ncbi:MAG: DNA/RNA nuclease SfsA [Proteobacteria bacterium]|nr:DNA/RNA nuclease SfsA [Pseudomonadota bacterium]
MRFFDNIIEGIFLSRRNRFVIECLINGIKTEAYLPNPGRLVELLYRGVKIYLTKDLNLGKLRFTVIGVKKGDDNVMLHTHVSNKVFKYLLEKKLLRDLKDFKILHEEYKYNNSRFDFLLEGKCDKKVVEVKTCTLYYDNIAMFPDAETKRGTKHLIELSKVNGAIVFLVQSKNVDYFLPEFNIDFQFANTLMKLKDKIFVKAYAIEWNNDFSLNQNIKELKIPWRILENHLVDSGSYFLIFKLNENKNIKIGERGDIFFKEGYYIYVGSGKKNLKKRIERHRRIKKKKFWHVDYFRENAIYLTSIIFRTQKDLECELAKKLLQVADWSINGFGASDCGCDTHMFGFYNNPLDYENFRQVVFHYRIGILKEEINNGLEM